MCEHKTEDTEECLHIKYGDRSTCSELYDCCDCGIREDDRGCGCPYCWSCNACEVCLEDED